MKKIGFFVTLPVSTVARIRSTSRRWGVPKWRIVDDCIHRQLGLTIGGPRRKARVKRG